MQHCSATNTNTNPMTPNINTNSINPNGDPCRRLVGRRAPFAADSASALANWRRRERGRDTVARHGAMGANSGP
eukprot:scaffold53635_cov75-Phaeocystis_antarctica.AAC.5